MSNLIQIQNGAKSFGSRVLFESASFSINENEHVGVIGPNGAGKSTLFKILVGEEELDSGQFIKSNKLRLGYLAQEDQWDTENTLEDFLTQNCSLPIWELKQLGEKLGLTQEHFSMWIKDLSGGYRMRSQLLYIIGCEPNLMLLDEPTNYLDLESLLILEKFLIEFSGAFLLISHDREFLKRVTDHILEVESQEVTKYPGNIEDYFEQKVLIREQLEKQNLSTEGKRKEILDFVRRFGAKATKARQAQSKLKRLDKLELVNIKPLPVQAKIRLPDPVRTGKFVLKMEGIELGYGTKTILKDVEVLLSLGDHLGVVGVNGAGKSTLLKALAGNLKPFAGKIEWGHNVSISYFAQHVADQLHENDTVYKALMAEAHSDILPQDALDLAGSLLFSNQDVQKPISVLSGGEKARVALGQILLKRSPFLILDEPTNHLDFNTVESLTQALAKYPGTVIIVSHDRSFIGRVATKVLEINNGKVSLYPGSYEEYAWSVERNSFGDRAVTEEKESKPTSTQEPEAKENKKKFNYKEEQKKLQRQIRYVEKDASVIEARLQKHQARMEEISKLLNEVSGQESIDLAQEAQSLQQNIDLDEYRWLQLQDELEAYQKSLNELQS